MWGRKQDGSEGRIIGSSWSLVCVLSTRRLAVVQRVREHSCVAEARGGVLGKVKPASQRMGNDSALH